MFTYFRHDQFRRYIAAFGSMFSNIEVRRRLSDGTDSKKLLIPIEYGPKERWLTRLTQDPDFTQGVAQIVPRISYEVTSVAYDNGRALKMLDQMTFPSTDLAKRARAYVGVPYNIGFDLAILVKYQSDGFQIVEQILPYFRPDLAIAMKPIPALGFADTIPIVYNAISHSDNYEGDFEARRIIIWTLSFTMKVNIYGPVRQGGKIQEVVIDLYDGIDQFLSDEVFLATEDPINTDIVLEDGTGRMVDESTPDELLSTGRVARIDSVATPADQTANPPNVAAVTTITEDDGDKIRNFAGDDEDAPNL